MERLRPMNYHSSNNKQQESPYGQHYYSIPNALLYKGKPHIVNTQMEKYFFCFIETFQFKPNGVRRRNNVFASLY